MPPPRMINVRGRPSTSKVVEPRDEDGEEGIDGEEGDGRQQHRQRDAGLGAHERGQELAAVRVGLVEIVTDR